MSDNETLWLLLKQSGLKMKYVARELNMTPATLRRKLDGTTEFKLSEAKKLAVLLRLDTAECEQFFFGTRRTMRAERRNSLDKGTACGNQACPVPACDTLRQACRRP